MKKLAIFSKQETIIVTSIFLIVVALMMFNYQIALRRSRDFQRRADLASLADGLGEYRSDFSFFPPSEDGLIKACLGAEGTLTSCTWGEDALRDVADPSYPSYMERLPIDPLWKKGYSYYYLSTPKNIQIFAHLEHDPEYHIQAVIDRALPCGNKICNYGRTNGSVPLEKSLQEYENELSANENKK